MQKPYSIDLPRGASRGEAAERIWVQRALDAAVRHACGRIWTACVQKRKRNPAEGATLLRRR